MSDNPRILSRSERAGYEKQVRQLSKVGVLEKFLLIFIAIAIAAALVVVINTNISLQHAIQSITDNKVYVCPQP